MPAFWRRRRRRPNVVTEWSRIVQPAVHSAAEPRTPVGAFILHTLVQLAVYDAVMAIEGGFEPFQTKVNAPAGADVRAAVATAAYRSARGRVAPSQQPYLDEKYTAFMAAIPEGKAKKDGVAVGEATAAGMLAARQNDNFSNVATYACSANPPPAGEFVPEGGCGTQPVDAKTAQVVPFTFTNPAQFRPAGPPALTSERWATDFEEMKTLGRKDSAVRTPDQTDVVYFWAEHTYTQWQRNLTEIATSKNLGVRDTARFLAMTFTAASDGGIAGFEAKYHYRAWRPRTAIPGAEGDGNAATVPDATWTPLLSVNHPEYPSGHSFVTASLTEAMRTFFGTDQVEVTLDVNKAAVSQAREGAPDLRQPLRRSRPRSTTPGSGADCTTATPWTTARSWGRPWRATSSGPTSGRWRPPLVRRRRCPGPARRMHSR